MEGPSSVGRPVARRAASFLRTGERVSTAVLHGLRRQWLIIRISARAAWRRAAVEVTISPGVRIDRGVQVVVGARTHNVLSVAAGCQLGRDLAIGLDGGELYLGPYVDLRSGVVLNVAGHLRLDGPNLVQVGTIVHCDEEVSVGTRTVLSERVTIVDSSHFHGNGAWLLDNLRTAPVRIGAHCWIGAKATITRGVTVGDYCVVGANSTLIDDAPGGHLVSGVPATVRGPVAGVPVDEP